MLLIKEITDFCQRHNMPESRFGRLSAHDPRLVSDLRKGVQFTEQKVQRIRRFMQNYKPETG